MRNRSISTLIGYNEWLIRQPTRWPNLPHRQPITLPTKPQTHENHTNRLPTLATAHPQGVRQLRPTRQIRNHQGLVRQLDPARSYPPSQKRLTMEWVKCLDRMPEPGEPVLIFTIDMNQAFAWLWDDLWYYEHQTWFLSEVSHWMPLPPNPF